MIKPKYIFTLLILFLLLNSCKKEASNSQNNQDNNSQELPNDDEVINFYDRIYYLANWKMDSISLPSDETEYFKMYFVSDSTVDNLRYDKVFYFETSSQDSTEYYIGLIRGQNDSVFFIPKETSHEILIYNYNWQIGDTLPNIKWYLPYSNTIGGVVENIDSIQIDGAYHKRWLIYNNYAHTSIINDIGAFNGLIPPEFYFQKEYGDGGFEVQRVCANNQIIYDRGNLGNIFNCDK